MCVDQILRQWLRDQGGLVIHTLLLAYVMLELFGTEYPITHFTKDYQTGLLNI